MKKLIVILILAFLAACSPPLPPATQPVTQSPNTVAPASDSAFLPNPAWQPGATNSAVTQDTINQTICVPGYTKTIRPPASYTDNLKAQELPQYEQYNPTMWPDANPANYEEDHEIPLEVGGNPTSQQNLWPQPRHSMPYNAGMKDQLENAIHALVCSGQMTLADGQAVFTTDWVQGYLKYVGQSLLAVTPVPTEP